MEKLSKIAEVNPAVAIAGDWFTAQGTGENLEYFGKRYEIDFREEAKC